ncbi:MAG: hypothetical protein ABF289_12930, partial [Clostridiales bacterium]
YKDSLIPKLVKGYNKYQREKNLEFIRKCESIKNRLIEVEKELNNLIILTAKIGVSETVANKITENENEKIQLEAEYKRIINNSDYNQFVEKEIKKSFNKAKKMMKSGKLSTTKKLIEMYIEKVVVYIDYVYVVFRFHDDLVL